MYPFNGNGDILALKLNSNGAYQWHSFFGSAGSADIGHDIAAGGVDSVYLTGRSDGDWNGPGGAAPQNPFAFGPDIVVLKLAPSIPAPAAAPTIVKSFNPTAVAPGGVSAMSFTITNANAIALTGLSFSDTFPAGLAVANPPAVSSNCSFSAGIPAAGATSFTLSGGTVAASSACTFAVNVTAAASAGSFANSSSGVSSNEAPSGVGSASATLTVTPSIARIPTLSEPGLLLMLLLLAGFAVWRLLSA